MPEDEIKGWKQEYYSDYDCVWKNNEESKVIMVGKAPYMKKEYRVEIRPIVSPSQLKHTKAIHKRNFKTKQSALKFAINWMKRHPNG